MDEAAGPVRTEAALARAAESARAQLAAIRAEGFRIDFVAEGFSRQAAEALRTELLCLASVAYLEACVAEVRAGAGSRGSAIVVDSSGTIVQENQDFRALVQETELAPAGESSPDGPLFTNAFAPARPLPAPDCWFENVWREYRTGSIFGQPPRATN